MENKAFNSVSVWMRQSLTWWLVFAPSCLVSCLVALLNHTLGNVADGLTPSVTFRGSGTWGDRGPWQRTLTSYLLAHCGSFATGENKMMLHFLRNGASWESSLAACTVAPWDYSRVPSKID
jgi:hypothetical protein